MYVCPLQKSYPVIYIFTLIFQISLIQPVAPVALQPTGRQLAAGGGIAKAWTRAK